MPDRTAADRRVAPRLGVALLATCCMAACGDGDGDGDDPTATTVAATTTAAASETVSPTTATTVATTPPVATTQPRTTIPPATSAPPTSAPPTLDGEALEIISPLMPDPFFLERVGEYGDLVVYDGESIDGDFALRCVAVGHPGESTWSEWCALPGDSSTFVVVDGIDPWVVEVGVEPGDVSLAQNPSAWVVTTSGCVDPLVQLIEAAQIAPAVATGIACAGGEAFLTYGAVFMQPGPVDGGGLLLAEGDEGWNTAGGGTSIHCAEFADGIDRCARFGVEAEMFEAVSPIPSPELIPPQEQFVNVREVTADVTTMIGDAPDVEVITERILGGLSEADAEVAPSLVRHDGVSFDRYSLLVVDVPLADDSIRSTTWAVWITTAAPDLPATIHRAYAWDNCGRGLADSETCV